ncbi:YciI family protein [Micromonospora sonneratiae]|uniref:YciI family protein n=1 Tax=Micromonospora sonneratiae TaxID=1184706 RepID=A0ABW3YGU6_9ACTN
MKYLLLIYQNPATWAALSDEERAGLMHDAEVIMKELAETGEWVTGEALAPPALARAVRPRDGVPVLTDGPFIEAKEQLAGFCMFECATPERAAEIAQRWPDARYAGVELRPLMTGSGG